MKKRMTRIAILLSLCMSTLFLHACSGGALVFRDIVRNRDIDVDIGVTSGKLRAGETVTFTAHLSLDGNPVDVLTDYLLHFTVLSQNFRDFEHIVWNITEVKPGTYTFSHTFTESDRYTVWLELADINLAEHNGDASAYLGVASIDLSGNEEPRSVLAEEVRTFTEGPFKISLTTDGEPMTVNWQTLRFNLSTTNGQKATLFGEGHYIITSPTAPFYRLAHIDLRVSDDMSSATRSFSFPTPGTYLVWAELYAKDQTGEVHTLTPLFTLNVSPYSQK